MSGIGTSARGLELGSLRNLELRHKAANQAEYVTLNPVFCRAVLLQCLPWVGSLLCKSFGRTYLWWKELRCNSHTPRRSSERPQKIQTGDMLEGPFQCGCGGKGGASLHSSGLHNQADVFTFLGQSQLSKQKPLLKTALVSKKLEQFLLSKNATSNIALALYEGTEICLSEDGDNVQAKPSSPLSHKFLTLPPKFVRRARNATLNIRFPEVQTPRTPNFLSKTIPRRNRTYIVHWKLLLRSLKSCTTPFRAPSAPEPSNAKR